jgi:hypothetical protein
MRKFLLSMATMLVATILVPGVSPAAAPSRQAAEQKKLNVLFIGNSLPGKASSGSSKSPRPPISGRLG